MGFTIDESWSFDAVRPFIFFIRDVETGTILFMGRVLDPTAS
jgi:serine protease inhibitor